jgi:hypothetical protein
MVHQYKLQELMKATDEQTEREKVMAKELAALREMVNQSTQPV